MKNNLQRKVASGMFWRFGERICAQGVSFVLSIVLARILMPEDYGLVSLILVFINIANVFVTNGLGESLVQRKNATDMDFSTVFYCSLCLSFLLYIVLFVSAPFIANFYSNHSISLILRVLALKLPISAFNSIQQAYVQRNMLFKKFFFSILGGTIASGIVGIVMAYCGFGIWALVAQYLINSTVDTLVLFITVRWYPKLCFSLQSAKELVGYGWKLTLGALINVGYDELRSLIIGKVYSSADLAYYNKGSQFPKLIVSNINIALNSVLLPAFAERNNNGEGIKSILRRSIKTNTYIIFPLMMGLGVVANPVIKLLLADKWLFCVPYLQIMCFYYAYVPISTIDCQGLKAIGRSDLYLKVTLSRRVIYVVLLLAVMNNGVLIIAFTNVITVFIAFIVNGIYISKYLNYSFGEQIVDLVPQAVLAIVMGISIYFVQYINLPTILILSLQVLIGLGIYIGLSFIMKLEVFIYLCQFVKGFLKQKKGWLRLHR